MGKYKVFIAEPIDNHEDIYKVFEERGFETAFGPPVSHKTPIPEKELFEICKDVNAFLGMSRERLTKDLIDNSKNLRIISKFGIGTNHIDISAATQKGILVANAPVHSNTVAEYAITLMMSTLRKVTRNENYIRGGNWRDVSTMGREIYGKTIGLIGFGSIGKELAKRLMGWGVNLKVYDPYIDNEMASKYNANLVEWDEMFKVSDVISLHLPLNDATYKIVGKNEFSLMKKSSIIINTSRGPIIDEESLITALEDHQIFGAGIDVFDKEPIPTNNKLLSLSNIIITPHIAGYTHEALRRISKQASMNVIEALNGEIPKYTVNSNATDLWYSKI